MQGTTLQSDTHFFKRKQNGKSNGSNLNSQVQLTAVPKIEGNNQYWPRVSGKEFVSSKELAMHQLVRRVQQRRNGDQKHVFSKSPMIIKAYRPPRPHYTIKQQSRIKKAIIDHSVESNKKVKKNITTSKVVQREDDQVSSNVTVKQGELEMKTWRPELSGEHQPYVLPSAEDRYVQNYKLQFQQAAKLVDNRYTHHVPEETSHIFGYHTNPLPPISSSESNVQENNSEEKDDDSLPANKTNINFREKRKTKSKNKAKQEKWKIVEGDAYDNNLRTKHKFTNAKRQFKDDLERIRELSAIREDASYLASIHSATSLSRIEENMTGIDINPTVNQDECNVIESEKSDVASDAITLELVREHFQEKTELSPQSVLEQNMISTTTDDHKMSEIPEEAINYEKNTRFNGNVNYEFELEKQQNTLISSKTVENITHEENDNSNSDEGYFRFLKSDEI